MSTLTNSSIGNKTHDKTPITQYQRTGHIKNRGKTRKPARYQTKAVRPSLRTHQNFEATTHYKTRIYRKMSGTKNVTISNPKLKTTHTAHTRDILELTKTTDTHGLCKTPTGIYLNIKGKNTVEYSSNLVRHVIETNWIAKRVTKLLKRNPRKRRDTKGRTLKNTARIIKDILVKKMNTLQKQALKHAHTYSKLLSGKKTTHPKTLSRTDKRKSNLIDTRPKNEAIRLHNTQTGNKRNTKVYLKNHSLHLRLFKTRKMNKRTNLPHRQTLTHKPLKYSNPDRKDTEMPTAGEARLNLNKRTRSPDNNNNPTPSKKACDPRTESAIPRPIEVAFGKRATQKQTVPQPTEAQLKQIEIAAMAKQEQEALAGKAAAAKAAKEASQEANLVELPPAIPGPSTLILPGPMPTSESTPIENVPEVTHYEVYPEAAQADPNVAYPQSYEGYSMGIDINFVCMLAEDPHKALGWLKT